MGLGLKFRDKLPDDVVGEFDNLFAAVRGFFFAEHNEDGTHSAVVADSLSVQGATIGTVTNVAYDKTRFLGEGSAVWTVDSGDVMLLRFSRIGQLVLVQFSLQTTAITVNTSSGLLIRLPELHAIPVRDSSGSADVQVGGLCEWQDFQASTNGIGMVSVQAVAFAGIVPYTQLELSRTNPATGLFTDFAISNNLWVRGSCWFTCEPNNVAVPYFGS